MGRYRKKPVVIEAVRLGWDTWNEMCEFADVGTLEEGKPEGGWIRPGLPLDVADAFTRGNVPPRDLSPDVGQLGLAIPTLEGLMIATEGDWVIRGVAGELYACKPDIFAATYEEVAS